MVNMTRQTIAKYLYLTSPDIHLDEYLDSDCVFDLLQLLDCEISLILSEKYVSILSTLLLFVADYNPNLIQQHRCPTT